VEKLAKFAISKAEVKEETVVKNAFF